MAFQMTDPANVTIGGTKLSELLSPEEYNTLINAISSQRAGADKVAGLRGQFDGMSKPDMYNSTLGLPEYQSYSTDTQTAQDLINKAIQTRSTSGNSRFTPSGGEQQGIMQQLLAGDPAGTPKVNNSVLTKVGSGIAANPWLIPAAFAAYAAAPAIGALGAGTTAASAAPAAATTAASTGSGLGSLLSGIGSIPSSVSSYLTGLTGNSVLGSVGSGALTGGAVGGGVGALTGQGFGKGALNGALTGGALGGISNIAGQALGGTSLGNLLGVTNPATNIAGQSGQFAFPDAMASPTLPWSASNGLSGAASSGGALSGVGKALGIGGGGSSFSLGSLLGAGNDYLANQKAQKDILNGQNNALNQLKPYLASGGAANARLSDLLGTSGNTGAAGYGSLTTPFTASSLQNDPGYQFRLGQGQQALDRQQASRGGFFSGSALKAAQDYGQGLADTTYNDAFQRDAATKQQQYGMFAGQAGQGQSAANAAGQIYQTAGQAKADAGIQSGNIISQLLAGSGKKYLPQGYY